MKKENVPDGNIINVGQYTILLNTGNGQIHINIPTAIKSYFLGLIGKRKMVFSETEKEIIIKIEK